MSNFKNKARQKKDDNQNKHKLTLAQALEGYRLHAEARRLSNHTLCDYFTTFTRFQIFLEDDLPLAEITDQDIKRFMASLNGISKKTALNYHIGLSALWTWAVQEGFVETHIVRQVEPPDPETRDLTPHHLTFYLASRMNYRATKWWFVTPPLFDWCICVAGDISRRPNP